ncbi:MAG TPA: TetR/AcrR family transcriptional regulator [Candidatus Binataceae bacterium]|nr:TetR/AcrR family transcriptional regulator [Candidatus Binataceae bacterium]
MLNSSLTSSRPALAAQVSKRERILNAGLRLFAHESYQAVTMDRVAQAASVAKGTLYLYFPSKEELYLGILSDGLESADRLYRQSVDHSTDVRERVRRAIAVSIEFYNERPDLTRLFASEEPRLAEARTRIIQGWRERGLHLYTSLIEEGQRAGVFGSFDPRLAALMVMGAVRSVLLYYGTERSVSEIVRELPDLLLRALDSGRFDSREMLQAG